MDRKQYDIKLEIDVDSVILKCPSGKLFKFERNNLPAEIYELTYRCVQDDAGLCQSIAGSLKAAAQAAVILLVLLAVPCFGQDRYQLNTRPSPYVRYGERYSNPYSTSPPKIYSSGKYLGELSQDRYAPDSVSNPYGRYGSRYSSESINNPYSSYGRYSTNPIWVYGGRSAQQVP